MDIKNITNIKSSIALTIWAMLVCSCGGTPVDTGEGSKSTNLPTQVSHNHTIMQSQDGVRNYRMQTPLLEKYDEAEEPYLEFREGIKVESFGKSDSIESTMVADYARYDITKELWEARGNVIARNIKDDKTLYTEQLFWDEKKKIIYTNLPAKVVDRGHVNKGIGFEADEKFESFTFNRGRGRFEVDAPKDSTETAVADSTTISPDDKNSINQ